MERNREKERREGGGWRGGKREGEEKRVLGRVLGFGMKKRGPGEAEERRSGGSKDLPMGK